MSAISIANQQDISPTGKAGKQSIFIWLDILGFSDAVEDESRYEDLAELLAKFQSLFNEGDGYDTTIISDGIILQITNPDYESFIENIKDIGDKQFRFICENEEFIRGGISVGTKLKDNKSIENKNRFISNGLARAVKIEERHVSWPVIGMNKKVLLELRKLFQINEDKEEYFNLTKGFNAQGAELYFIDFLSRNNDEDKITKYYELLNRKVKELRNDQEKESKDNSRILNKYFWQFRYYHERFGSEKLDESLVGTVL